MFENYQDVSWELCARCPRADWGINISLECSGTSGSDIKCRIFGNVSCNTCVRVCSPVMPVQKIKFHVAQKKFHLGLMLQAKNFEDVCTQNDLEAIW